jgi:hypothetical protein
LIPFGAINCTTGRCLGAPGHVPGFSLDLNDRLGTGRVLLVEEDMKVVSNQQPLNVLFLCIPQSPWPGALPTRSPGYIPLACPHLCWLSLLGCASDSLFCVALRVAAPIHPRNIVAPADTRVLVPTVPRGFHEPTYLADSKDPASVPDSPKTSPGTGW